MKIAFNPSTVAALTTPPNNKDITFDLRGQNIFARGVKFCGTDTNTWRDIKINNVSIGSNVLDLRNGSNTTLTNINGVVTINSTWRPVVDNLTSNSTTSSLSANQGRILAGLINGKSDSDHNHDDRYLKLTGGTMSGTIYRNSGGSTISGRDHAIIRQTYAPGGSNWNPIACVDTETGTWTLGHLSSGDSNTDFNFCFSTNTDYNAGNNAGNYVTLRNKVGTIALLSEIPDKNSWNYDDRYYTKAESNAKYITDITTSVNKLTFTKNGSNIVRDITVNVVHSQGNLTNISNKDNTTKASSGLYIYNSYGQTIGTNSFSSVLSINTGGTIQIAGDWGDDTSRNLYWRSQSDRAVSSYPWKAWRTILDSENYSSTLDSRYYTESEVNNLLNAKLNRQNLSYGTWNPRGYNLAADYYYNGGNLSISENGGKMYVSIGGQFYQNEGQYRVLDTSDVSSLKNDLTIHQYLSNTDTKWYPLIFGGSTHNNTSDSTGTVYKSYDKLSWQTSSQTLYATNIQTNNIKNLSIGGGIYWNPYVESTTDSTDVASITVVKSGVAGGSTILVLSQMNDANDTIQFKTNTAARLYHNSYPILTTQNTYVNNNKGYINGTEITQVNNANTLDGAHLIRYGNGTGIKQVYYFHTQGNNASYIKLGTLNTVAVTGWGSSKVMFTVKGGIKFGGTNESVYEVAASTRGSIQVTSTLVRGNRELKFGYVSTSSNVEIWMAYDGTYRGVTEVEVSSSVSFTLAMTETTTKPSGFVEGSYRILASTADNVTSASKLQTPRNIWGQRFDGTADIPISVSAKMPWVFFKRFDNDETAGYIGCGSSSNNNIYIESYTNSNIILGVSNSNVGIGTSTPAYKLHVNGTFRATNSTVSDLFVNTGDATLKIYTGITTGAQNDGNVCFQTSIDATDGQSHVYPTQYKERCNIVLQPRGGQVYIGTNPSTGNTAYKLYVNSKIFSNGGFVKNGSSDSYVLLGGGGHSKITDLSVANADMLDGYHENSFLRYRGATYTNQEATLWSQIGIKQYNNALPDNLTGVYNCGSVISLPGLSSRFEIYASHWASSGNGLYYRSGWDSDKRTWLKFIDSSNIGSQSVNYANSAGNANTLGGIPRNYGQAPFGTIPHIGNDGIMEIGKYIDFHNDNSGSYDYSTRLQVIGNYRNTINLPSESGTLALTSYGGDDSTPIFLGYLNLDHGSNGTVSSSFYCLGYSVPFTYTRGGNYCRISIPDTTRLSFYINAAIASVNYSGGGMDTWVGVHRNSGAWWLHCYASGWNEVRVKGFRQSNENNDSWWGGNPLFSNIDGANRITVCIFGHVRHK